MSKKILVHITILTMLFFVLSPALASLFVTDSIKITLRSGPGTQNKIIRMLPSGTKLEKLDQTTNWIKVRTERGYEGWVLKRYVMDTFPKSVQLEQIRNKIQQLQQEKQKTEQDLQSLKTRNQQLTQDLNKTQATLNTVQEKYSTLKRDSGRIQTIKSNYSQLQKEMKNTQQLLETCQEQKQRFQSRYKLYWYLAGGGTVFLSAIIGFILGRLQRKKSRKVYF